MMMRDRTLPESGDVESAKPSGEREEPDRRHSHPERSIAPPGECAYCDQRRLLNAEAARRFRKKGKGGANG
jgi:hypothetical protein